jgi:hypothetical protein
LGLNCPGWGDLKKKIYWSGKARSKLLLKKIKKKSIYLVCKWKFRLLLQIIRTKRTTLAFFPFAFFGNVIATVISATFDLVFIPFFVA